MLRCIISICFDTSLLFGATNRLLSPSDTIYANDCTTGASPSFLCFYAGEFSCDRLALMLRQHGLCAGDCLVMTDSDEILSLLSSFSGDFTLLGLTGSSLPGQQLFSAYALLETPSAAELSYFYRTYAHRHGEPAVIAATRRLLLREFAMTDFEALYAIRCHPLTTRYLEEVCGDAGTEQDKFRAYLSGVYPFCDFALWGIFDREGQTLLGQVGFSLREGEDTLSFGYLLAPQARHRGYAAEAANAALTYAKSLGLTDTLVHIMPENIDSQRVLAACQYPYRLISSSPSLLTYQISLTL